MSDMQSVPLGTTYIPFTRLLHIRCEPDRFHFGSIMQEEMHTFADGKCRYCRAEYKETQPYCLHEHSLDIWLAQYERAVRHNIEQRDYSDTKAACAAYIRLLNELDRIDIEQHAETRDRDNVAEQNCVFEQGALLEEPSEHGTKTKAVRQKVKRHVASSKAHDDMPDLFSLFDSDNDILQEKEVLSS